MEHRDLSEADPEVYKALKNEVERQESESLEMIASENFVPRQILQAQGSVLTNKYAEGYPGERYYAGCEYHDKVENLARKRACEIFDADHANVQPHSGSQANFAAYFSQLDAGDKILGPVLSHGGHLTHGHGINFSGDLFDFATYGINKETERFEKEDILQAAKEHEPDMIVCGYSAYPREIDFEMFREVADEVDALLMCDIAHISGLVAAGEHPNPFPQCDIVTTTTHKSIRGARGGMILCKDEYAEDVDSAVFPYSQGGPLMHQIAGKAVCFKEAMRPEFEDYAKQIKKNTKALAEGLRKHDLELVSGGTDNHLVLVDLREEDVTGKEAESALEEANIVVNKNAVPYDPEPPMVTSGIRIGTPALTTRGMEEEELEEIGEMIGKVVKNPRDSGVRTKVREKVSELLENFELYEESGVEF
ncbi:serine hydroxymethyltransferase [Candidatus Nanohalobium constans]|uniref:Serine hydroxymethyltransferase n=1 Tax=Candidatus Nanohalobium constans TaxID=2565781 RepID=A0A5Q0UGI7_9ARCH|nr:serine hydroxymethyltransferase [Candidatus Nanohalobium constans]QGA80065.1 glycine/serine hydroxymethyltransferase [Candidatus Nanohalobium constans]